MATALYVFNPDHDMALANFTPYYKASSDICRMAADLSVLPAWYAGQGGAVKVDRMSRIEAWKTPFLPQNIVWTEEWENTSYSPWGWNPSLKHTLLTNGVDASLLPGDERLSRLRYCSGRQRCVEVLNRLRDIPWVCGEAVVCSSLEDVRNSLSAHGEIILKAPWSGSGRGLFRTTPETWSASLEGWVSRVLRTQGEVMAEPVYDKIIDFAMEFRADGTGEVCFAGYSLFDTDAMGHYKGNYLLSNGEIERQLTGYVPLHCLHAVRDSLSSLLSELLGSDYAGYLGVDMMICRQGETFRVHPCVEINLRMNMGVVSRLLYDRYLSATASGKYIVEYYTTEGEALQAHQAMIKRYPLEVAGGRIRKGYLSLTPVCSETRYQAYIIVEPLFSA